MMTNMFCATLFVLIVFPITVLAIAFVALLGALIVVSLFGGSSEE